MSEEPGRCYGKYNENNTREKEKRNMKYKKILKGILAIVVMVVGIIASGNVKNGSAFVQASADYGSAIDSYWENIKNKDSQKEEVITPETIVPGNVVQNAKTYTFRAGETIFNLPIDMSASQEAFLDVTFSGFSKTVLANVASSNVMSYKGSGTFNFKIGRENGTQLNLLMLKDAVDYDKDCTIIVKFYQYVTTPSAQTSLPVNKWAVGYNKQGEFLYKIKSKKSGILILKDGQLDGNNSLVKVTLLNAKKKKISEEKGGLSTYAVKKGTYYLKVKTEGAFKFKYTVKSIKNTNTTKAKAVTLKKGKQKKGTIGAGVNAKSYQWYKMVIPKKKKIKIALKDLNNDGGGKVCICDKDGKEIAYYNSLFATSLEKGIYYLRVNKINTKGSFYYTIQWK